MKIRSRWVAWWVAFVVVSLSKLLFLTCRKVHVGVDARKRLDYVPPADDPERFVLCVWHDALLIPTFAAPRALRQQTCCLVSQHQDGSYLANAMALLGYSTVRGSSRRGGTAALRQLLEDTAGRHIVFTPDGPGGPRRQLKQGCVFVASQLGRTIVPGAFVATRGWRPKGRWTDLLIPKPFSTIYVVLGEPITIPLELPREQLDHYIGLVQQAMDRLNDDAERMARGEQPASAVSATGAAA
jgi:lysophospholipid acyltransferase (LPLAT)-like uncharacterized protein